MNSVQDILGLRYRDIERPPEAKSGEQRKRHLYRGRQEEIARAEVKKPGDTDWGTKDPTSCCQR